MPIGKACIETVSFVINLYKALTSYAGVYKRKPRKRSWKGFTLTLAKVPCEHRSQASPLYIHRKLLAWIPSGEAI